MTHTLTNTIDLDFFLLIFREIRWIKQQQQFINFSIIFFVFAEKSRCQIFDIQITNGKL